MKFAFLIMTEFQKYEQAFTLLNLVKAAQEKGHSISGIFCFEAGVLNLRKELHLGRTEVDFPELMSQLSSSIPIFACQTWVDNYGLTENTLIKGAEITGLGELSNITADADKLIAFGDHA